MSTGAKQKIGASAGEEESRSDALGGPSQIEYPTDINAFRQQNEWGEGKGKGKGKCGKGGKDKGNGKGIRQQSTQPPQDPSSPGASCVGANISPGAAPSE